jgi:hypothetical protein
MSGGSDRALKATSIEGVQDCVDKLVLCIFEAARGHTDLSSATRKTQELIDVFRESVDTVNKLVGIDRTKAEQEDNLFRLSQEYESLKVEILILESELTKVIESTDRELDILLG